MLNGAPEAEVSPEIWTKKRLRSSELIQTSLKICKNFYRKILRVLQESLTIVNRKIVTFPIKIIKRSCKNWQNFLEKS